MFNHVMLGTDNPEEAKKFYDAIFKELGYKPGKITENNTRCVYAHDNNVFILIKPVNGEEATSGNGMTIGFRYPSVEAVNRAHEAGTKNGGITCEDPPGWRTKSFGEIYLAYLRDPAGNKICLLTQ